jgi:hypothetical protein
MNHPWTCTTCGKTYSLPEGAVFEHRCLGPLVALASERAQPTTVPLPQRPGPGTVLTGLLAELGFIYTPECNCRSVAAAMDAGGAEWCRANAEWIIGETVSEARRRSLISDDNRFTQVAFEATAAWLIDLAVALVEEERSPSLTERVRLRAVRFAARTRFTCALQVDHDTSLERHSHA